LGKFSANTFQANDLNRIINKYYYIAQSDIRAVNEDFFGEISTGDLMTNFGGTYPNEVPLPTDYEKITQVRAAYTPQNIAAPLQTEFQVLDLIKVDQISDPSYTVFSNPTAMLFDNALFLAVLPAATVSGGLQIFYIVSQTPLANDTDKPNIFADYHDVITWGSLIDVGTRLGKTDLVKQAMGMFAQRRADMKAYASQRAIDMKGAYVEGQGNLGGWDYNHGHNSMS